MAIAGQPDTAEFTLPVAAKAEPLKRAPAPRIGAVTWFYGLLWVAGLALSLLATAGLSRRLTTRRRQQLGALDARPAGRADLADVTVR